MIDPVILSLTKRIEHLEEQVAWLEGELRLSTEVNLSAHLRQRWGLTITQSRLLELLYRRKGRFTSRGGLADLMWENAVGDQPGDDNVKVQVHHIRQKIHRNAIITEPYVGYRIGDQIAEEITAINTRIGRGKVFQAA